MTVPPISTAKYQNWETPEEAVLPLAFYLWKAEIKTVWEPAAGDGSIVRVLSKHGFNVIFSDIASGFDFLSRNPDFEFDAIVTNPPFSKRIEFLRRAYELGKPFALLMPTIFTVQQGQLFKKNGIELLVITKRLKFVKRGEKATSAPFSAAWFCYKILPKPLIFF